MTWVIVCLIISYLIFITTLHVGWSKCTQGHGERPTDKVQAFTVLIPFRNEQYSLTQLIQQLSNLPVTGSGLEQIILVDDNSDSHITESHRSQIADDDRFLMLSNEGSGKLSAIRGGIKHVKTNWIVAMDADNVIPDSWLPSLQKALQSNEDAQLILFPLKGLSTDSLASKYASLDFASLIGSGLSLSGLGRPIMANGAHMAYKKDIAQWDENYVTGDDVFLLHKIKAKGGRITQVIDKGLIVETEMPDSWSSLLQQRVRWASKSKLYKDRDTLIIGWYLLLFNLLLWVLFILGFWRLEYMYLFLTMFLVKSLMDWTYLYRICSWMGTKGLVKYFPLASIVNSLMFPIVMWRSVTKGYSWKGRDHR